MEHRTSMYRALRDQILDGRLRPGARLPSTRELARTHGLARGTIVSAFDQLRAEGYVEGTVGSGTYVSATLPDALLDTGRPASNAKLARPPKRHLSASGRRLTLFPNFTGRPTRAFRTDQPALDLFPTTLWAQLAGRRLRRATANLLLSCPPMGYRPLQEAVAAYLGAGRGVRCSPDQIAIVGGAQAALDLVTRVLVDPGDRVCIENPGYPGAALVFEAAGARLGLVPVDDDGMQVPSTRHRGARLAYVTPGHQFPLGVAMSLSRRLAILEWARRERTMIIEDDYDSEYRYSGRPVPALQGLDRHGQVFFVGSFSKVLFPSLRLGYLVVPEDLVDTFTAALSITSRHAPLLEQAVLTDFLAEGHFARHVRRMREVYADRVGVLVMGAREHLAGRLDLIGVEAGLQTAAYLGNGIRDDAAAAAAARHDVEVTPLSRYTRGIPARQGLQLGFAAVDTVEIRRGVTSLAAALDECTKPGTATRLPRASRMSR